MNQELREYYEYSQKQFDEEEALDTAFQNLEFVYRRLLTLKRVRRELDEIRECNVPESLDVIEDKILRAMACLINLERGTPEEGERYDYERLRNLLSERIRLGVQV
jgi:hypothetical protein